VEESRDILYSRRKDIGVVTSENRNIVEESRDIQ
jgi:hypothetical protein